MNYSIEIFDWENLLTIELTNKKKYSDTQVLEIIGKCIKKIKDNNNKYDYTSNLSIMISDILDLLYKDYGFQRIKNEVALSLFDAKVFDEEDCKNDKEWEIIRSELK